MLQNQSSNRNLFSHGGGYLNFITDNRVPEYHGDYVGQAINLDMR